MTKKTKRPRRMTDSQREEISAGIDSDSMEYYFIDRVDLRGFERDEGLLPQRIHDLWKAYVKAHDALWKALEKQAATPDTYHAALTKIEKR